ncbi:MAG: hypothetical protein ACK5IC_03185 [Moheibacter sp.]
MDQKTIGIVSYLGLIGLIIAFVMDKEKGELSRFHIRQNIGLNVLYIAFYVIYFVILIIAPKLGMVLGLLFLLPMILWIIGLIGAVKGEKKLVPMFGEKFQEIFKSI